MRLHRVRVEHVRGLESAEIHLAERGVTVLEAPNESGKTTLMDAVDLLLEHKDSTRKHEVRALQPVGRDVGSLVEVELTCGEWHLTVRKRFNKDRMTELELHAPERRQLAGDEAHTELRRILARTTDLALYAALRFRQDGGLVAPVLADSQQLAARLDEIAGGTGDAGDDALLSRVRREFGRYYTPSGQDGQPLRAADDAVAASQARVDELTGRMLEVERDARRLDELERERVRLTEGLAALEPTLVEHRRRSERVRSLREELRTREARAEVAAGQLERTRRDVQERETLVAAVDRLRAEVERRGPAVSHATGQLELHEQRLEDADAAVEAAEVRERDARVSLDRARAAADLGRRRHELAELTARQRRVEDALAAASAAEAQLEAHPLRDGQLDAIRTARDELRLAHARLDDAAPTVAVSSHRPVQVTVDGEITSLASGEAIERSVSDGLVIDVPGVLEVAVRAGSSLADRQAEVERARERLQEACAAAGVSDPAAADELAQRRRDHERTIADRDALIARELAGWSREQLADRIRTRTAQLRELEARLAPDADAVVDDPQLRFAVGDDVGAAQLAEVEARDVAARDAAEQARAERSGLAQQVERLRGELRLTTAQLDAHRRDLAEREQQLAAHRAGDDDAALLAARDRAEQGAADAERAVAAAQRELEELRADEIELLAGNAEQRAGRLRNELHAVREELTELRARIEVLGGEGVGEHLDAAQAELERARDEAGRLRRRAAAAATLRQAFEQARDAAYGAYREPLRDRIVRAGRVVFGEGLDVTLDDELRVVERHLDGTTLPWERLSAGAREQLSILTGLAAADLAGAGEDGGVPLVLDDALGFTDPARLERLCAVLGRVRGPQVIVLTCDGDRFQAIGDATVVRLRDVAHTARAAVA